MGHGVFIHRADSIYEDTPAERYQFPARYLRQAEACVGDWIVYLEPRRVPNAKGYYAIARVQQIVPDLTDPKMYVALIEPRSYLEFKPVPFSGESGPIEQGLLNDHGQLSGRKQAAVRALSTADFNRIVDAGLAEPVPLLPRSDAPGTGLVQDERTPFIFEQPRTRVTTLMSRPLRDRVFRGVVLTAYRERCAVTGLRLINGGGRAEVEAAHIRPVEADGPDIVSNGIALSGTAHWMFDRGLIGIADDLDILVSRQANDADSIRSIINPSGKAIVPPRTSDRPHPAFLQWHREHVFKH